MMITGQNCGFFITPVIQMAILDIRKSLEFFGLILDSETHSIEPIKKRRKDDVGIEHFGLPRATVNQLIGNSKIECSIPLEKMLADINRWGNKRLAHFTLSQPEIKLDVIRDASKIMIDVYFRLVFDATGRPRPQLPPVNSRIP